MAVIPGFKSEDDCSRFDHPAPAPTSRCILFVSAGLAFDPSKKVKSVYLSAVYLLSRH